jgi:hypothetical protein
MEFEFEKRRVTKGEIRDLIFHEILEYHPQLNGTERTNFLYPRFFRFIFNYLSFFPKYFLFICFHSLTLVAHILYSAVDQFDKQFTHLEETGGKSDPVVPLERKHASLPR